MVEPGILKFDLAKISDDVYSTWLRGKRIRGLIPVAMLSVLGAFFLYFAVAAWEGGGAGTAGAADLVFVALFGGGACLLYWSTSVTAAPPANLVEISSEGITAQYPHNRPLRVMWSDPRFSLKMCPRSYPHIGRTLQSWFPLARPRVVLTDEAAAAIERSARRAGLEVETIADGTSSSGTALRIRQPKSPKS